MGQRMTQLSASRRRRLSPRAFTAFAFATVLLTIPIGGARAQMLGYVPMQPSGFSQNYATEQPQTDAAVLPEHLRRQTVSFDGSQPAGTIVIDTGNTVLYYVLGQGRAIRYGVGVGRAGFTWSGVESISRKAEWPDWHPPAEMIARQPYLPRFVAGGLGNPLGARAMYLGSSEYRIHGTNDPTTIGKFGSSGCIRMTNEDVVDLFNRVNIGTRVVVLPKNAPLMARGGDSARKPPRPATLPSGRQVLNLSPASLDASTMR